MRVAPFTIVVGASPTAETVLSRSEFRGFCHIVVCKMAEDKEEAVASSEYHGFIVERESHKQLGCWSSQRSVEIDYESGVPASRRGLQEKRNPGQIGFSQIIGAIMDIVCPPSGQVNSSGWKRGRSGWNGNGRWRWRHNANFGKQLLVKHIIVSDFLSHEHFISLEIRKYSHETHVEFLTVSFIEPQMPDVVNPKCADCLAIELFLHTFFSYLEKEFCRRDIFDRLSPKHFPRNAEIGCQKVFKLK